MSLLNEIRTGLRFARREGERRGFGGMRAFERIHSLDSDRGAEWLSTCVRDGSYILVWRTRSEADEEEAKANCDEWRIINGTVWGFSFRERE